MSHYSPIVAALITMLMIFVIQHSKVGKRVQDIPNERSLHDVPTPRIGGMGLMAGCLAGWVLMFGALSWWWVIPLFMLIGISVWDDWHGLPVTKRLVVHLIAAAILIFGAGVPGQGGWLLAGVLFLATVWMTNLYNFMDGSDGLAGGMALFGFSMYGLGALMSGDDAMAMINFTIGAGALGFLYSNFPPARVFMGDAGSIPLGFLAAAMGIAGWMLGYWALWFPVLIFSPFILDATVTLIRRALRGAKIAEAHREHYYQRLVQMGWSHRKVAIAEYVLMAGAGLSALAFHQEPWPWQLLLAWATGYMGVLRWIDYLWKRKQP